jgi:hypothetical protein
MNALNAQSALLQQLNLLLHDAETLHRLSEMVSEVYAEGWDDGYTEAAVGNTIEYR